MRTKALLCAAALAAGAVSTMAQSNVYSLNVVGYVNKAFQNGNFVLVCNPLNNPTNDLNTVIATAPDNTQVWRWLVGIQDLDTTTIPTYSAAQHKWIPDSTLNPGEGFFVVGGADFTNTFVGEVLQGALSINLVGNGNFEAIGSKVPVGGSLTNVLAQYPATDNDQVWLWRTDLQDFDTVNIPTWSAAQNKWIPDANLTAGDGFFLVRAGGPVTYTRNFTVQ
jgi:hypothetical protein